MTKLKVDILVQYFVPAYRGGGPIRTIEALTATHHLGHEFTVYCSNTDLGEAEPLDVPVDRYVRRDAERVWYINWASTRSKIIALRNLRASDCDYLYINSVFSRPFSVLPLSLVRVKVLRPKSVVVAPRGEFGDGAMNVKRGRKKLFLRISKILGLYRNVTWHASSAQEAKEIGNIFPGARTYTRADEVLLPTSSLPPSAIDSEVLKTVFVGRLSPKKGVHKLVESLMNVDSPIELDIYGAFEEVAYQLRVEKLLESVPSNVKVSLKGPLPYERVRETFSKYHLFLFPTSHENFGHTIPESLSASCPVMISDVTPFTDTVRAGGGVIVEQDRVNDWTSAIQAYSRLGRTAWEENRSCAGDAYESWRSSEHGPSVFQLVQEDR